MPFISSLTELDQNSLHASPVYVIPQHFTPPKTTFYILIFYTDLCDTVLTMNLSKSCKIRGLEL